MYCTKNLNSCHEGREGGLQFARHRFCGVECLVDCRYVGVWVERGDGVLKARFKGIFLNLLVKMGVGVKTCEIAQKIYFRCPKGEADRFVLEVSVGF